MAFPSGAKLGRYEIHSQLGAGGMGEVYLARDARLKRKVALKVLPANLLGDGESLRRFEREARAASALNHPNIVTVHEIAVEDDTHFIITEFIEGQTLRRKLQAARPSPAEAVEIAVQVAVALDAAHRSGIVHRDIKPENIMLRGEDDLVKVLDFGVAKLTATTDAASADAQDTQRTEPGVVIGTVSYMSPEQTRALEVDARADIWSLGAVMYEMLTGELPFTGDTMSDVIAAILKTEFAPPSSINREVPIELENVVGKCLAKDRAKRYQTAKDLLADLRRVKKQVESGAAGANKALTLDETLAEAYNPLAAVRLYYYRDWPAAEQAFRRGIELNPNFVELYHHYSIRLLNLGRGEEALDQVRRAVELDPLSLRFNLTYGRLLFLLRRYDRAVEQLRKTLELDQNFAAGHEWLGYTYEQQGRRDEAVAEWVKDLTSRGETEQALILERTHRASGFDAAVRALTQKKFEQLNDRKKRGEYVPAASYMMAYTRLGDKEQAFAWFEKVVAERSGYGLEIEFNPLYDSLRGDARFQELLRRVDVRP